ncbi:MAG: MotA/TolQ/ExbB proton channel family protein [Pirellulaceae bacterium]|nr:MotA/TolQ/ExbB proton channel family protein [Pirellulaceae bacterium]
MSEGRDRYSVWAMLGHVGWPLILGLAACTVFYAVVLPALGDSPLAQRYFTAHPVLYLETALFFIGLAALGLKLASLLGQLSVMRRTECFPGAVRPAPVERCSDLLDELHEWPSRFRRSCLGRRLQEALESVERKGAADGLEDELRYLSEQDEARQHESYALVRIVIWATPMLGFLGTVVGITQALGDLDPKLLATAMQTAMEGLMAGLYVAFDTTALALSLSMLLMFVQFLTERLEGQLLSLVDARVNEELIGRFETLGSTHDPHLATVQRMAREVVQSSEKLVARQVELWRASLDAAQQQWTTAAQEVAQQLRDALTAALGHSLSDFAVRMAQTESAAAEQAAQRWEQWQTVFSHNARIMQAQQQELSRQSELMVRITEATGDVIKLETALNQNLTVLAGAKHFEDTVMSLAAAIHLLNTRLGAPAAETRRIELTTGKAQGRAA